MGDKFSIIYLDSLNDISVEVAFLRWGGRFRRCLPLSPTPRARLILWRWHGRIWVFAPKATVTDVGSFLGLPGLTHAFVVTRLRANGTHSHNRAQDRILADAARFGLFRTALLECRLLRKLWRSKVVQWAFESFVNGVHV